MCKSLKEENKDKKPTYFWLLISGCRMKSLGQKRSNHQIWMKSYASLRKNWERLPSYFQMSLFYKYVDVYAKCSQVSFALKQAVTEKELGCMQITALRCDSQASLCSAAETRRDSCSFWIFMSFQRFWKFLGWRIYKENVPLLYNKIDGFMGIYLDVGIVGFFNRSVEKIILLILVIDNKDLQSLMQYLASLFEC